MTTDFRVFQRHTSLAYPKNSWVTLQVKVFFYSFWKAFKFPLKCKFSSLSLSLSTIPCPCRTVTSRRRLTMRSGCVTGPANCWLPAPRKTRRWRQQRACRPAALASWLTCQSYRGWRKLRSCRRSHEGHQTQGQWTTGSRAKEKWPSQASKY